MNHILAAQWMVTLCVCALLFVLQRELALSALLGGLVCVLPNLYFARQLFLTKRSLQIRGLVWSAFGAEFVKMMLALGLFAVVFIHYEGVHPLVLLATYFAVHSCNWAVPLLLPEPSARPST